MILHNLLLRQHYITDSKEEGDPLNKHFGTKFSYCPSCGTKMTDEYRFCPSCGKKLIGN
ncbi:zinc-ribbon domain-containing protein [Brevibacillus sp. SYSU BS000544]|uniref:zinc-ribbon domain-containing protein n=1 Tax=Brevibacillus sp. SYSU BS000544 TaxID=3416443 RepID=UPI003CE5C103